MPTVTFTQNLRRHVPVERCEAGGATVREVLDGVFADYPTLRGYLLDDQGAVRRHVVIFVDGQAVTDRADLAVPVAPGGEVYVMQALSGG